MKKFNRSFSAKSISSRYKMYTVACDGRHEDELYTRKLTSYLPYICTEVCVADGSTANARLLMAVLIGPISYNAYHVTRTRLPV